MRLRNKARSKKTWRAGNTLLAVLLVFLLLGGFRDAASQPEIEDLTQDRELQTRARVLEAQERIRLLYSQGNFRETIQEADALLRVEADNPTAISLKDAAERRLARGDRPARPGLGSIPPPPRRDRTADPSPPEAIPLPLDQIPEWHDEEEVIGRATEEPREAAAPPPAPPPPPTTPSAGIGDLMRENMLFIGIGVAFIVLAVVLLVVIMMRRREQEEMAPATAMAGAGAARGGSLSELPTVRGDSSEIFDEETHHGGDTNVFDAPTAVGGEDTSFGEETSYEEDETFHGEVTAVDHAPAPEEREEPVAEPRLKEPEFPTGGESVEDSLVLEGYSDSGEVEQKPEGLGIDYSDTDSHLSASQAQDVYQTSDKAFAGTPEEPVSHQPPAAAGISEEDTRREPADPDDISQPRPPAPKEESKGGEDLDQTKPFAAPPPSGPAPTAPESSEEDKELSYNSLMFGSEKPEARPQEGKPEASSAEGDDLTLSTFNQQYSNVMFGADMEETKIPEAPPKAAEKEAPEAEPAAAEKDDTGEDQTVPLPTGAGETPAAPPSQVSSGGPKLSMFDRQKEAGKAALEADDYSKAVQCLSVAASLKPGDKEVRAMLEEAREKRRA